MRVAGVVASVALLMCAAATPAAGEKSHAGGVTYVEKSSTKDAGYRTLRAKCPKRTHVLGGGMSTGAGYLGARLHHTYPIDGGDDGKTPDDGWTVTVQNAATHGFTAYTTCSKRRPAYVTKKKAVNANDQTNLTIDCPNGTVAVAGGHRGSKDLAANSGWPTLSSFTFFIDNATNEPLPLTAYAVCVRFPVDYEQATLSAGGNAQTFVGADCAPQRHVIGGGLSNGGGVNQIWINSSFPLGSDEWGVWVDNLTAAQISTSTHAVCAPNLN